MAQFAVYYRRAAEGKMSMMPISAENAEDAEFTFLRKEAGNGYCEYWVCTEHIAGRMTRE